MIRSGSSETDVAVAVDEVGDESETNDEESSVDATDGAATTAAVDRLSMAVGLASLVIGEEGGEEERPGCGCWRDNASNCSLSSKPNVTSS